MLSMPHDSQCRLSPIPISLKIGDSHDRLIHVIIPLKRDLDVLGHDFL